MSLRRDPGRARLMIPDGHSLRTNSTPWSGCRLLSVEAGVHAQALTLPPLPAGPPDFAALVQTAARYKITILAPPGRSSSHGGQHQPARRRISYRLATSRCLRLVTPSLPPPLPEPELGAVPSSGTWAHDRNRTEPQSPIRAARMRSAASLGVQPSDLLLAGSPVRRRPPGVTRPARLPRSITPATGRPAISPRGPSANRSPRTTRSWRCTRQPPPTVLRFCSGRASGQRLGATCLARDLGQRPAATGNHATVDGGGMADLPMVRERAFPRTRTAPAAHVRGARQ